MKEDPGCMFSPQLLDKNKIYFFLKRGAIVLISSLQLLRKNGVYKVPAASRSRCAFAGNQDNATTPTYHKYLRT